MAVFQADLGKLNREIRAWAAPRSRPTTESVHNGHRLRDRAEANVLAQAVCRANNARPSLVDILAGVGLPLICLAFDPIVFGDKLDGGILSRYRFVAYFAIGTCMLSLLAWLVFRRPAGLFVGLLGGGTLIALIVGIVLLPFSLMFLVIIIGALGSRRF